jgi:hypothetical protein
VAITMNDNSGLVADAGRSNGGNGDHL